MSYFLKLTLAVVVILTFTACPKPVSVNDVYFAQADTLIDEAVHHKNSLEWWYFTGHLHDTLTQEEYGIEYVFFHFNPRDKSDYMMGNFAISIPQDSTFKYDYAIVKSDSLLTSRLPLELGIPYRQTNWQLSGKHGSYQLKAEMISNPGFAIDLKTDPLTGAWLHGEGTGYQHYGNYAKAGYYSYPKLETSGTLSIDGRSIPVRGSLWYDRQWNCIGVYQKEVAWDWIAMKLSDESDLMVFKLYHRKDQKFIYGGSYRNSKGDTFPLSSQDLKIEEKSYWQSPRTKISYPVEWLVSIPKLEMELTITPRFPDQELSLKFAALYKLHYWEGMSLVYGRRKDQPISGKAYVEITNRKLVKK